MAYTTGRPGDYVCICDRCGEKDYASKMTMEWDGLWLHKIGCFEERQPQDFVRGVPDFQNVPIARPQPADYFIAPNAVTPENLP